MILLDPDRDEIEIAPEHGNPDCLFIRIEMGGTMKDNPNNATVCLTPDMARALRDYLTYWLDAKAPTR